MTIKFLLHLFLLFGLTSCLSKTLVTVKNETSSEALTWNYLNPTILSGEMIPFAFSNGTPAYTTNANAIGVFNAATLEYTPPINQAPLNHVVNASDALGKTGNNTVKIVGFQNGPKINFPLTFGDQNFVTSAATLVNNNIFISSIVGDSSGWERWVIFKSADYGSTWSQVDQYVPYEEGESQPLSLAASGNDLYACGYVWGGAVYNSEWLVRKSSDNGVSWSNVDEYHVNLGKDHVCYDIDVHAGSGNLYTVGYDEDIVGFRGIIRESTNNGTTWNTIGTFPGLDSFYSVKVSPAGVVWAIANTGDVYQGTYALGVWNWLIVGNAMAGGITSGHYVLRGELEIVSETTAYFSAVNASWKIAKTIDGGATWVNVYSGPANSVGQGIKRLSTGELVSTGYFATTPNSYIILTSTDNGATWSESYNNNTVGKQGMTLVEANDASVLAFGIYRFAPYQIINMRSTDSAATWSQRSIVYFKQNLYTDMTDIKKDALGNLWASAWTNYIDTTTKTPWVVIKSSDNGVSWVESDVFTDATSDLTAWALAIGPSNEIYSTGAYSSKLALRKSSDSGVTWTEMDTSTPVGKTNYGSSKVTVATNGDVFYSGIAAPNDVAEIRRGTANGTVWTTTATFPIAPGSTAFSIYGLEALSDGSLWISGNDKNASAVDQHVIYRSTDNGITFTEVLRETGTTTSQTIKRLSSGEVYVISLNKIKKTTDNGATWVLVYDGSASGGVKSYTFDALDRIYILSGNGFVYAKNQFTSNWFEVYDYSLINNYYNNSVFKITDCGNSSKVCVIGHYDKSIEGAVHQIIPLVVP